MVKFCQYIANSESFQTFILFLIFLTAISMGFEAIPEFADSHHSFFLYLNYFVQGVFVFEIGVRWLAFAPNFRRFFRDPWNTFDFVIVTAGCWPEIGSFTLVARLLRILRTLRIFSTSDHLRSFMDRLKESWDEMAYAGILFCIFAYIFTISGYYLFAEIDPAHWGTLGQALMSTFYLVLLQDIQNFVAPAVKASMIYLVYFLLFYFVFISLFIGVITAAIIQALRGKK